MNQSTPPVATERTIAIIATALILGIVIFGATVTFLNPGLFRRTTWSVMQVAAMAAAFAGVVASSLVPAVVTRQNLTRLRESGANLAEPARRGELLGAYQVQFLIGYALLEGPALFGLTVALVEKSAVGLATAGFCLFVMLTRFPSADRINGWITRQANSG